MIDTATATRIMGEKNPAAVALGSMKSDRKAAAARENGQLGGRPSLKAVLELVYEGDGRDFFLPPKYRQALAKALKKGYT